MSNKSELTQTFIISPDLNYHICQYIVVMIGLIGLRDAPSYHVNSNEESVVYYTLKWFVQNKLRENPWAERPEGRM